MSKLREWMESCLLTLAFCFLFWAGVIIILLDREEPQGSVTPGRRRRHEEGRDQR